MGCRAHWQASPHYLRGRLLFVYKFGSLIRSFADTLFELVEQGRIDLSTVTSHIALGIWHVYSPSMISFTFASGLSVLPM